LLSLQRILSVQYTIPDNINLSPECRHLISRIFVADPEAVSFFVNFAKHIFPYCSLVCFEGPLILLSTLLVWQQRISIPEIKRHEWFLENLPADLMDENTMGNQFEEADQPMQSIDTIMQIISEATIPAAGSQGLNHFLSDTLDMDEDIDDLTDSEIDIDSSGEIVYAI